MGVSSLLDDDGTAVGDWAEQAVRENVKSIIKVESKRCFII